MSLLNISGKTIVLTYSALQNSRKNINLLEVNEVLPVTFSTGKIWQVPYFGGKIYNSRWGLFKIWRIHYTVSREWIAAKDHVRCQCYRQSKSPVDEIASIVDRWSDQLCWCDAVVNDFIVFIWDPDTQWSLTSMLYLTNVPSWLQFIYTQMVTFSIICTLCSQWMVSGIWPQLLNVQR